MQGWQPDSSIICAHNYCIDRRNVLYQQREKVEKTRKERNVSGSLGRMPRPANDWKGWNFYSTNILQSLKDWYMFRQTRRQLGRCLSSLTKKEMVNKLWSRGGKNAWKAMSWVYFTSENYSPGDSFTETCEKVFQRGKGRSSVYMLFW